MAMKPFPKSYKYGIALTFYAGFPIGLGMAVLVAIEKGFSELVPSILFWVFIATLFNVAIALTVGTPLVYVFEKLKIANFVSLTTAGVVVACVVSYMVLNQFSQYLLAISVIWGFLAASAYWYGWHSEQNAI